MSSMVLSGDTSGAVTLTVPAVAGTNTITLPAATGTVQVSGNMPAFSAYASANQTITSSTFTKIQINTEEFDTNSYFDTSTYRFTPLVAGYYQVSGCVNCYASTAPTRAFGAVYKNGTVYKRFSDYAVGASSVGNSIGSVLVYLNGSTDYVELYGFITATTAIVDSNSSYVYFQASMVRAA